jgi:hypothetical protein
VVRIEINPARVERVVLESKSAMEADFDDAVYRLIRPLVNRIDRTLRKAAREALGKPRSR